MRLSRHRRQSELSLVGDSHLVTPSGGEIVIGPETYAQLQGSFQCEALTPTLLRGKQQPIALYRVEAQR